MRPQQDRNPEFASREPEALERGRLQVVVGTVLLNVVAVAWLTFVPGSNWRTGLALNFVDNALLAGFAWRRRDYVLIRLMVYGLVVGAVELVADAWLVNFTRTLDYSVGGGPMLWRSPLWMPLAWEVVTVQFAVIGLRLMRWRPVAGLLLTGVLGAVNIPYYEEMARLIHWWRYADCRMISGTPYYIILSEFGIAMGLAWGARPVAQGRRGAVPAAGILCGLWIFACYAIAFFLTDRIW
jgi:hypothetical protein